MWLLLEEHLTRQDDGRCCYGKGWSDAKVAEEAGLSEQYVHDARAAEYGALVDPEIEAVEAAVDKLRERLEELAKLYADETRVINDELGKLRGRVQAMARA